MVIILLAADFVRVRITVGPTAQTYTMFSISLLALLTAFPASVVTPAAVVAATVSVFFESNELHKRLFNAVSFAAASVAACLFVSMAGNGFAEILAAGVIFEFINYVVVSIGLLIYKQAKVSLLLYEWASTAYLAIIAPILGFVSAFVFMHHPALIPFVFAALILVIMPEYRLSFGKLPLRGSWHTKPGTYQSPSKLYQDHSHF